MPRYFFHVHNEEIETHDEEGVELPDIAAARARAIRGIRSILGTEVQRGRLSLNGHVSITSASGETVMTVLYAEALEVAPRTGRYA